MKPPRRLPSPLEFQEFWARLKASPRALLVLDYDGTLSPLQPDRDRAFPWPGVREALERILRAGRTRMVLLSGREARQAVRLLGLDPPPEAWGVHGRERLLPDGRLQVLPVEPAQAAALEEIRRALGKGGLQDRVEAKPGSVALHWRGLPAGEEAALREFARKELVPRAEPAGLEVRPFDGGLEFRAPGPNKGGALRVLKKEEGLRTPCAFLGDDLTDEEGFAVLGPEDLSVLVGNPDRPTRARFQVLPPEGLLSFLEKWASCRG